MIFLAVGSMGFVFMLLFDWVDSRVVESPTEVPASRRLKGILASVAAIFIIASGIVLAMSGDRVLIPVVLRAIGWLFSGVFFILLIYSLFLEIPFSQFYGGAQGERKLVTTGTYALSRHPGVLWFFIMGLFLFLATGSKPILAAVALWTVLDLILVFLEDRFFFPRIFGEEYGEYRRRVPFLLPTAESIAACFSTIIKKGDDKNGNRR